MRGRFTLVELMIVVAIVGILAAIAIPSFYEMQIRAKEAEISTNVAGIETAERAYVAQFGAPVIAAPAPALEPSGKAPTAWVSNRSFDSLGWAPDGDVRGAYAVVDTVGGAEWFARGCIDADDDDAESACEAYEAGFGCDFEVYTCFTPDTPVALAVGTEVPIGTLQAGDEVLAYDGAGHAAPYPVAAVMTRQAQPLWQLELDDGTTLQATAEHPFFTGTPGRHQPDDESAFTVLHELRPGDRLWRWAEDHWEARAVRSLEPLSRRSAVVNVTVGGAHTYFVDGILVHNKAACATQPNEMVVTIGPSVGP